MTAEKYAKWVNAAPGNVINLCMDYETIGEHHGKESGIFEFYRALPVELKKYGIGFVSPSEIIADNKPVDTVDFPYIVSWADMERDLSAWIGNNMQESSLEAMYELYPKVIKKINKLSSEEDKERLLDIFGKLQTSDHYYYMSTKYWSDGDVHKYFSPFNSPQEAYLTFQAVLRDFRQSL